MSMEQQVGQVEDLEALPQPIGEYRPIDVWQDHVNHLFYRLRGNELRQFYQTFASADYRLAHALADDYYDKVVKRDASLLKRGPGSGASNAAPRPPDASTLTIMEWGPGNGNLAACFLSRLKTLDREGLVYRRVRYLMVDSHPETLESAKQHPDLAAHRDRIQTLCGDAQQLQGVKEGAVDRIICTELWNDLPTKLLVKKGGDVEEEHMRPNLSEDKAAAVPNWSEFVQAFDARNAEGLKKFPHFFDDLIWEKEYHKVEWKDVPYRKTISEFLRSIDEQVLVPVNLGAFATIKEAKRLLAPNAIGFSSFDAGTSDMKVLNDPEKPCYGQFGGQYSFMINFLLAEGVAKHLGVSSIVLELQREFVGSRLSTNVMTLMDVLACQPQVGSMAQPWELDRLTIRTIQALNGTYESPYERQLDFPLREEAPPHECHELQQTLRSLKRNGLPDTVAYLTEGEIVRAQKDLEPLGYDRESILMALGAPAGPVEYYHFFFRP